MSVDHAVFVPALDAAFLEAIAATSNDVLNLMYKMYSEVKTRYTIALHPEVKFFGKANEEEKEIWQTMTNN